MRELFHALAYWLAGRCWACHRRVLAHTPGQRRRCDQLPVALVLPETATTVTGAHVRVREAAQR
jgi:hypothetical protein